MDIVQVFADYLNQFPAGTVFLFLIGLYAAGKKVYQEAKKILEHNKKVVTDDIQKQEQLQTMLDDIENLKTSIETLNTGLDSYKKTVEKHLEEDQVSSENSRRNTDERIGTICEHLEGLEQKIPIIEQNIMKIEKQISILIGSDVEYIRAYITDSYNKYVKEKRQIDLISLQNVESIYNRFLHETGGEDEFLSKLMRELRNLPTTVKSDDAPPNPPVI